MLTILSGETLKMALSGADLYYLLAAGFGNVGHLTTPFASLSRAGPNVMVRGDRRFRHVSSVASTAWSPRTAF
jgi:hypothetical protein